MPHCVYTGRVKSRALRSPRRQIGTLYLRKATRARRMHPRRCARASIVFGGNQKAAGVFEASGYAPAGSLRRFFVLALCLRRESLRI